MAAFVCPERLYFDEFKREVVRMGDPRCAFLFRAVGQTIDEAEMKKYKIMDLLTEPKHEDKMASPEETPMQKLTASITSGDASHEDKGEEPDTNGADPAGDAKKGKEK